MSIALGIYLGLLLGVLTFLCKLSLHHQWSMTHVYAHIRIDHTLHTAIKTRNVWSRFNESKFIGIAVYNILVVTIILIAITFGISSQSPATVFRIRAFVLLMAIVVVYGCCIGRHLWSVVLKGRTLGKGKSSVTLSSPVMSTPLSGEGQRTMSMSALSGVSFFSL